ncbi:MAG: hypothetical protein WA970_13840 [Gammaproteobacteria bacterium]|jgi:hypothetical protein
MSETNLFEIETLDEDHSTRAKPTAWLHSLPLEDQLKKVQHYLSDLQGEYKMVGDGAERAHLAVLMGAAKQELHELERRRQPPPSFRGP